MTNPRRGWTNAEQAKPAAEYVLKYGHELLRAESGRWPRYGLVTTPSADKAARPDLVQTPAGVSYARWLDYGHLQDLTDRLPDELELIVGLGGGIALDASKYVALSRELPLVLVPTLVSTGAIIHGYFARWEGHRPIGDLKEWPWIDLEDILVDYDVVLRAPDHLNTAGLGDVLCGYAGLAEWRRNTKLGIGPPFDAHTASTAIDHHNQIVAEFPNTLGTDGGLTPDSVRFIMTAVHERDARTLKHPAAPGADHAFWLGLEQVNDKGWIHGEAVALAAIVIAWHCDEGPETLAAMLDACMVHYRPGDVGVSREELSRGLEFAPEFMSPASRDVDSILRNEPLVGARFDALWDYLCAI